MRRLIAFACAATAVAISTAGARADAPRVCVGSGAQCFAAIQAALDAAHAGDTIRIGPGVFAGPITIDKSVNLVGAGANATTIEGGGPVVTIGELGAPTEPTVSIDGVTIRGGVNTSSPFPFVARGGGISVPRGATPGSGATVTISESVITGNRAEPTGTSPSPSGVICPGGSFCPFALGGGGGIANAGTMRLNNVIVSDNDAGGPTASDAAGGGIWVGFQASLTVHNSTVTANNATVTPPNGRFAEGGGIFGQDRVTLTIANSVVSDNSASLSSTLPFFVGNGNTLDMNANGGGIHDSNDGSVTIDNTKITDNTISVSDLNGEPYAFDAGLAPGGRSQILVSNSTLSDNHAIATVGSSAHVGPSGSALDIDGPGTISNTHITGNTTVVTSPDGVADAGGAVFGGYSADNGAVFSGPNATQPALIVDSVISGNSVRAVSTTGVAKVHGGGILNNGQLALRNDRISNNSGDASGPAGYARGGGIWNGAVIFAPPVELILENTNVTDNVLTASPGLAVQGGGLFTAFPVTLDNSRIARNTPDDCYGC
jgi:hypothetical protein